jgi:hypothetical protein
MTFLLEQIIHLLFPAAPFAEINSYTPNKRQVKAWHLNSLLGQLTVIYIVLITAPTVTYALAMQPYLSVQYLHANLEICNHHSHLNQQLCLLADIYPYFLLNFKYIYLNKYLKENKEIQPLIDDCLAPTNTMAINDLSNNNNTPVVSSCVPRRGISTVQEQNESPEVENTFLSFFCNLEVGNNIDQGINVPQADNSISTIEVNNDEVEDATTELEKTENEEDYETDIEDIEDTILDWNKEKINSPPRKFSRLEALMGEPLEDGDQVFMWDESLADNQLTDIFVYKPVHKRVKPVPATFPQDASVTRRIPEDPLLSLPELSKTPPEFVPTERLTMERLKSMKLNEDKFMLPEEEKLFQ